MSSSDSPSAISICESAAVAYVEPEPVLTEAVHPVEPPVLTAVDGPVEP